LALSGYSVEIPETAIIVSSWESLHSESEQFPDSMLMPKYGGNVIEVDGRIMLATTEDLTLEIQKVIDSIPPPTEEQEAEFECMLDAYESGVEADKTKALCSAENPIEGAMHKRACDNSRCFTDSLCLTYNDCHVCRGGIGWGVGNSQQRGYCI
jgi:hypothetical protein